MAASLRDVKVHTKRKLNELEDITNSNTKNNAKNNKHKKAKVSIATTNNNKSTSVTSKTRSHQTTSITSKQHQTVKHHQIRLENHPEITQGPLSPPEQQRSPSPTDISSEPSSPAKCRSKSVSFDLPDDGKVYEGSPLLTPKEEDDDHEMSSDEVVNVDSEVDSDQFDTVATITPPGSISKEIDTEVISSESITYTKSNETISTTGTSTSSTASTPSLNTNTDYIALTASHRLISTTKSRIDSEIVELSRLRDLYADNDNKEEVVSFFMRLLSNDLHLPTPHKIVRCPVVDWSKYHSSLSHVSRDFESKVGEHEERERKMSSYKSLQLFKEDKCGR
ncbi:uncharacterized protein RJT20DRAFT_65467 [Scheffersomyces xylosifermentans]|uniref:uncharacterized protein n=1 Tax=Scheffersomyces xylosifermentans TaxID=1304137 RepID=UPI00315DF5B3